MNDAMSADFIMQQSGMQPPATMGLGEYLAMAKRRQKPMLIIACLVFGLALLFALLWPAIYSSSAKILIEEQEIPQDMVRSTINSFAQQQIQVITQRVMTTKNIMEVVRKFELYPQDELNRMTEGQIVRNFTDAVDLDVLSGDGGGGSGRVTYAFSLSYESEDPKKARQATGELVNLYLNLNQRTRTERTESTEAFLRQEAEVFNKELNELEEQMAEFKRQNKNVLPDSFQYTAQNLSRLESKRDSARLGLREIDARESQVRAQLAQISAYAPTVLSSGEMVLSDVDRLKALQAEYRRKAATYNANHPDIKKLRRKIDNLSAAIGDSGNKDDLQTQIKQHQSELENLLDKYAPDHPDVVAEKRLLETLEAQLVMTESDTPIAEPDNPEYIRLKNQLSALVREKGRLRQDIISLDEQIEQLNQQMLIAPQVEKEYLRLQRNHVTTQDKYLDLTRKLGDAELAGSLEQDLKGQRFTLVEPPSIPGDPVSPNRPALMLVGFFLACAAGVGMVILLEALDQSIRTEKALIAVTGSPPLVSIPYIKNPQEQKKGQPNANLYIILTVVAVVALLLCLAAINYFYKPLDVFWFVTLRKLGIG